MRLPTCIVSAVLLFAVHASADTTDWTLGPGGTYTSSGGAGSTLSGTNIPTLLITGDGTPDNNGLLTFTSGAYNGNGSNWSWGAGGTLMLTGCIAGVTASTCTGYNNVTLISDDFQSVQIESILGNLDAVFGNITGTLNADVATYFGVPQNFDTAAFATAILTSGHPGSSLTGSNILGLIKADPPSGPTSSLPENWGIPESLAFFGFATVAFTLLVRFRIVRIAF